MALEDFTTYVETDPGADLTVTANAITFTDLSEGDASYIYKDFTAAHFNGDFEHLVDFIFNSSTGDGGPKFFPWVVANSVETVYARYLANGSDLELMVNLSSGNMVVYIVEMDSGSRYLDSYTGSLSTRRYLKIKRDEAVGTYGTIYCYIYSDSARTILVDTLSVALHTSKKDFRYLYAETVWNDGTGTAGGDIQNLDIQEGTAIPIFVHHYRQMANA